MAETKRKFFITRLLELFHRETMDSYRVRVLHPLLALHELVEVYDGLLAGNIKRYEDLEYCISETLSLLREDQTISFKAIEKKFFIEEILKKINKENYPNVYPKSRSAIKTIIRENENYAETIIASIKALLDTPAKGDPFLEIADLDILTGTLATELLRKGFTKSYLYTTCHAIFLAEEEEFEKAFAKISALLTTADTTYVVWFKIYAPKQQYQLWPQDHYWEAVPEIPGLENLPNPRVQNFGKSKRSHFFTGRSLPAPDHFAALQKCKQELAEVFDLVRLAHHNQKIELLPNAVVYPTDRPELAGTPRVGYIPDGKFPDGEGVLQILQEKTAKILQQDHLLPIAKEKIKSAIRYLRFGHESVELEHQLINYWIGLEYLYSNERDSTFTRIKEYLPTLHSLVYLRRNLQDFHQTLMEEKLENEIKEFDPEDETCLLKRECLESIRDDIFEQRPLQSFRAWKLKNRILEGDKLEKYLKRHRHHLEWHLARIYRARNLVVHEASYGFINQTLTSNLRYYLTFSLSMIMDYFSGSSLDARNLQEYFSLQQLRLDSLKYQKLPVEQLCAVEFDFDFLA